MAGPDMALGVVDAYKSGGVPPPGARFGDPHAR